VQSCTLRHTGECRYRRGAQLGQFPRLDPPCLNDTVVPPVLATGVRD